jgi:hypothetical protein
MSQNVRTDKKSLSLPPAMLKLFRYALINVDCEAMKAGERRVTSSQLISAIVLEWLMEHEHEIRTAFYDCVLEVSENRLPAFHTSDYLLAITAATGANVPELPRVGDHTPTARRAKEAREFAGIIRRSRGRPTSPVLRTDGRPLSVRGGSSYLSAANSEWAEALRDLILNGEDAAGPSDPGLGEVQTPSDEDPVPYLVKIARSRAA